MGQWQLLPWGGHLADDFFLSFLPGDVGSEGCDGLPGPRGAGGEWVCWWVLLSVSLTLPKEPHSPAAPTGPRREGLGFAGQCPYVVV